MTLTIEAARDAMDAAAEALDRAARPYFCDGRHGVWRAMECGKALPPAVEAAANAHHAAAMQWARARRLA